MTNHYAADDQKSQTSNEPAIRILRRLLSSMENPPALRLWNDLLHDIKGASDYTLVIRDPEILRLLVLRRDPLILADAYFRGSLDIEGNLYRALAVRSEVEQLSLSWRDKLALLRKV